MSQNLPDVQNETDRRKIPLKKVGVKNVLFPLDVNLGAGTQSVQAQCDLAVSLSEDQKGTNMSRLVEQLAGLSHNGTLKLDMQKFLKETLKKTQSDQISGRFAFTYFMSKAAPSSKISAPMPYQIIVEYDAGSDEGNSWYDITLTVKVLANNCCPCSKAISKGGAHNQRIEITFEGWADEDLVDDFSVEDLITQLESSASCEMYPILKRPDEKIVTERQYDNPKFVEDVVRDAVKNLKAVHEWHFMGYKVSAQAFESIHAHDAYAETEVFFVEDEAS
ncbi:MAG TPA: GTP cyclohydrolase FolE2 [Candidatus Gracilibacteria bacterium]